MMMNWNKVPTVESFPVLGERVLAYTTGGAYTVAIYHTGLWWHARDMKIVDGKVTHWMRLPQPPVSL